MERVEQQDINDNSMKKLKKKKNKELISSNEEAFNVEVGSQDPKKLKSELGNADASDAVGDLNSDSGNGKTPEKEKIMPSGSIMDAKQQEKDNKKKKNREKSKVGDKGETSSVLEAPKQVYSERKSRKKGKSPVDEINVADEGVINEQENDTISASDGEVACDFEKGDKQTREEGQVKEKKKKKRKDDDNQSVDAGCNDVPDSRGLVEIQANAEVVEEGEVVEHKKKKKKRKDDDKQSVDAGCNDVPDSRGLVDIQADAEVVEKGEVVEHKKKKKKKKSKEEKKEERKNGKLESGEVIDKVELTEGEKKKKRSKEKKEKRKNDKLESDERIDKVELVERKKKSKKRKEYDDSGSSVIGERNESAGVNVNGEDQKQKKKKKEGKEVEPCDRSAYPTKKKKVTFAEQDEVFPVPKSSSKKKGRSKREDYNENGEKLIRGKRFSKEEDEIIKQAVLNFIEEHQLGENGVEMVMRCSDYPELKKCWKEIGKALPLRPTQSVYARAHTIFLRSDNCTWTEEDIEYIRKFYEKNGAKWKQLAEEMGRHRIHVKDTWRGRVKLADARNGDWSQDEYQKLFDSVNLDLSMKIFQEKKIKHGMLRDNIGWENISQQVATRSTQICCMRWYKQLTSPLVTQGEWTDSDDYRLIMALMELDAACEDDVDWDYLLEHRSGDACRKRWQQMVRHIGYHGVKPFIEQVEVLSKRYCPDILEAREEYENRPPVD